MVWFVFSPSQSGRSDCPLPTQSVTRSLKMDRPGRTGQKAVGSTGLLGSSQLVSFSLCCTCVGMLTANLKTHVLLVILTELQNGFKSELLLIGG